LNGFNFSGRYIVGELFFLVRQLGANRKLTSSAIPSSIEAAGFGSSKSRDQGKRAGAGR
jgi:hypothetical protein